MADIKINGNLDLQKAGQLLGALMELIVGSASSPAEAQFWYNSSTKHIEFYNGTTTKVLAEGDLADYVAKSLFDANTMLYATTDNTPVALTVAASRFVGRKSTGDITAMTPSEARTELGLTDEELQDLIGAMVSGGTETGITVTYDDTNARFDFVVSVLNSLPAPTGDLSLNSQKITNLATPTAASDAATKGYVDNAIAGLSWKDVRVASTANVTLASGVENGDTIDGVTLATGDRVLLKNQSTGAENGIYTVNASGAPTRATDYDADTEIASSAVIVDEGTTNAGTVWILTTNLPITVGSTSLSFSQFGAGSYVDGAGLTLTGLTFSVNVDGSSLEINSDTLRVKAGGITDAMLASTFTKKFSATIGDGATNPLPVVHSLNTTDVQVEIRTPGAGGDMVLVPWEVTDANTITLNPNTTITSNQYRITVIG